MVKSTRHSKTKREPVTIDLEAEAVKGDPGVTEDAQTDSAGAEHTPTEGDNAAARAESTPEEPSFPEGEEASTSDKQEAAAETGSGPDEIFMTEDGPEEEPGRTAEDRAYDENRAVRPSSGGSFGRALAAGVAGGVIALVLAGGLQWAGMLPALGARGADPAVETVRQDIAALQNELSQLRQTAPSGPSMEELEQALAEPRREIGELRDTVTALQAASPAEGVADFDALEQRLSEMESRLASLAETAGGGGDDLAERLAEIETRMDSLAQAAEGVQQAAGANAERLEEITGQVAELSEQVASEDEGPRLALIVAASALKSAVERGTPFASELETYTALAPDATGVEPLEQYAQAGIPTQAELAEEAPEVASRIANNASTSPPDAGFLDRLMASARSAVTVRPVGEVEGDTPEAIAARMEAAVQRGDYAQALDEYEALPPDAKETASDFAEKLRARQAADDVLEKALSGALQPA